MPAIDYRRARAQLRLAEVLALIGYEPRWRQGERGRGPWPLHGSQSPRSRVFCVHLGRNLFHCFGCGAGGNALDLWAALQRLPLHAAVLDLCRRLHQEVPRLGDVKPPGRRPDSD
jgi:DNA primase